MFLTFVLVSAIAIALIKLGAMSVWVAVLSLALKSLLIAALAAALYFGLRLAWRRRKGSGK